MASFLRMDDLVDNARGVAALLPAEIAKRALTELGNDIELIERTARKIFNANEHHMHDIFAANPQIAPNRDKPLTCTYSLTTRIATTHIGYKEYFDRVGQICWPNVVDKPENDETLMEMRSDLHGGGYAYLGELGDRIEDWILNAIPKFESAHYKNHSVLMQLGVKGILLEINALFLKKVAVQLKSFLDEKMGPNSIMQYHIDLQPVVKLDNGSQVVERVHSLSISTYVGEGSLWSKIFGPTPFEIRELEPKEDPKLMEVLTDDIGISGRRTLITGFWEKRAFVAASTQPLLGFEEAFPHPV